MSYLATIKGVFFQILPFQPWEKAWYILSRDACRDLRRMTFKQPFYIVGVATVTYVVTAPHDDAL